MRLAFRTDRATVPVLLSPARRRSVPMRVWLAAVLSVLILSGCGSLAVMHMLPTGEWSVMSYEYTRLRTQLNVSPVYLPKQIAYRPVESCVYRGQSVDQTGRLTSFERTVALRPVEDRLLITQVHDGITSTALITQDGRLLDFNTVQLDGYRTTSETFPAYAAAESRALRSRPHIFAHAINELKLAFPHYSTGSLRPGGVIASVTDEYDRHWAQFVYRGLTTYNGVSAAVLDLTKTDQGNTRGPRLTIGFTIVDIALGIPLVYVMDSGSVARLRVELTHCAR